MSGSETPSVTLPRNTWRRVLAGEARALETLRASLRAADELAAAEERARARMPLAELWGPEVISAALDFLELEATTKGRVVRLRCPGCGERRAFLYRDMTAPTILCNRRNSCPVGQHGGALLFELLADRVEGKGEALELLRGWARTRGPVEWRPPRGHSGRAGGER